MFLILRRMSNPSSSENLNFNLKIEYESFWVENSNFKTHIRHIHKSLKLPRQGRTQVADLSCLVDAGVDFP